MLGVIIDMSNQLCQLCQLSAATHFCQCTGAPTLLCMNCLGKHCDMSRAPHQILPLQNRNPGHLSQLVHVTESSIRFFDFQRAAWRQPSPLNSRIRVNGSSIWAVLDGEKVFVSGGGAWKQAWNSAYLIENGWIEQTNMCRARFCFCNISGLI